MHNPREAEIARGVKNWGYGSCFPFEQMAEVLGKAGVKEIGGARKVVI